MSASILVVDALQNNYLIEAVRERPPPPAAASPPMPAPITMACLPIRVAFLKSATASRGREVQVTPAMAAGVSQNLWSMEDVVAMIEESEAAG
jgi:hypothetical protein